MKSTRREICCDRCKRVVGQLAAQSKWRRGTISMCAECQETQSNGKLGGSVEELRKLFGMG